MDHYKIKAKIDNQIYRIYNYFVGLINIIDFQKKAIIKKNIKYKNKHKGEKCFILGTGPSIKALSINEIDVLKKNICFGVNSFYTIEHVSGVVPSYYVLMDRDYINEHDGIFNDLKNIYCNAGQMIITDYRYEMQNRLCFASEFIYISAKKYPVDDVKFELVDDISAVNNVVSYSILVAMYMGFSEIYLLGCDYNHFCINNKLENESAVNRSERNLAYYLKFFWITTEFHYMIRKRSERAGIKITNLTKNSLLDAYECAHFDVN